MRLQLERWDSPASTLLVVTDETGTLRALDFASHETRMHRLLRHLLLLRMQALLLRALLLRATLLLPQRLLLRTQALLLRTLRLRLQLRLRLGRFLGYVCVAHNLAGCLGD